MNVFFASTGIIFGLAGAGVALWKGYSQEEHGQGQHGHGIINSNTNPKVGGGDTLPPIWINKYQLYLFVAEFLRLSNNTKTHPSQQLSHFEFYRIIFKLIKPIVDVSSAGVS